MGESEESKKQHVIFGSAGMAASGMMAAGRSKSKRSRTTAAEESPSTGAEIPPENDESAAESGEFPAQSPVVKVAKVATPRAGRSAVLIGHTGAGDFGSGMSRLFQNLDGVRLCGIADLNEKTVEASRARASAPVGYTDVATMLRGENPELVCVASSWTEQRSAQIKAALEAGAHVLTEAPLAPTLKEADELVSLARAAGRKLAVRHPMRLDPHLIRFHAEQKSLIGELCRMNVWGACDETAGGEDLLREGVPLFDLVRWFAGEVGYGTAGISKDGISAIAEDAHESGSMHLGPLLGDTIHAEFEMASGVRVSFLSDRKLRPTLGPAGIEFVGTKSRMRLFAGAPVTLSYLDAANPSAATRTEEWKQWPETGNAYHAPVDQLTGLDAANRLVVQDWLDAIASDTEPAASGENAAKALEMAHGIWQAAVTMKRAYFPLANRLHPLSEESR